MKANSRRGKRKDSAEAMSASLVAAWTRVLATQRGEDTGCATIRHLDDYVTGRTALVVGDKLLSRVAECAHCRLRLASLDLMEVRSGKGWVWRLEHVRSMVGQGSGRAAEVAARIGAWLRTMAVDPSTVDPSTRPVVVDAKGRLVVYSPSGAAVGATAEVTVCLSDGTSELVLFRAAVSSGRVEAVVDVSCCAGEPMSLRPESLKLDVRPVAEPAPGFLGITADIESALEQAPIHLVAVDRLLDLAVRKGLTESTIAEELSSTAGGARTNQMLQAASALLGRYVGAWSAGNQGEIAEDALDLLVVIEGGLSVGVPAVVRSTADAYGSWSVTTESVPEEKRLKADVDADA